MVRSVSAGEFSKTPQFTNRLVEETSPYLQLHAHNPVNWYPWGKEAFALARREDKPIFLSVGYSTCYWCHVMEREVFADETIAQLMNEWFVNIKVDREERPDVDQIYMMATQLITQRGGWPNSVFLTTDLEPFYAGTYFPPEDRHGRPGFPRLLSNLNDHWQNNRARVDAAARELASAIRDHQSTTDFSKKIPDTTTVLNATVAILKRYDATNGGFGGAPKFPPSMRLELLMDPWIMDRHEKSKHVTEHTLQAMADGGIYDHIGGGFHRYATDAFWRVPHFEKMLYNQAQLVSVYAKAYARTGNDRWRFVVDDILRYVSREMTSPEGAFFSALDAETETIEGKYYVWTKEKIYTLLGTEGADLFFKYYELAPMPEGVEGVVFSKGKMGQFDLEWSDKKLLVQFEALRAVLRHAREERTYPLLDDKIITSWNGMMIAAYAEAAEAIGTRAYQDVAEKAGRFIIAHMLSKSGTLKRVYREGTAKQDGFLEDYAFFANGLLALYKVTGNLFWLETAQTVCNAMIERFWDTDAGGFFYSEGGTDLIIRIKSATDSALPSANGVATKCLLQLARATGERRYLDYAVDNLKVFGGKMATRPASFTEMVSAANEYLTKNREVFRPPNGIDLLTTTSVSVAEGHSIQQKDIITFEMLPEELDLQSGGGADLSVLLQLAEGWHVNANPASKDWLIPTSLIANSDLSVQLTDVKYPPGKPFYLAALEETLSVYDRGTTLIGTVSTTSSESQSGELHLLLQYQACDESQCLPPGELEKTVKITLSEE